MEHSPQMKNPNEPPAPRQTRLVLTLDAETSFLWSSWGLAMNHSWNTQTLVSIWTSEPARYIHSICASAMRTGGGNPSRMGLGQRPRPMLHFVLSRPKGLDEQRKYCPRMGIRIGPEGNTVLGSLTLPSGPIRIPILGTIFFGFPPRPHRRGTYLIMVDFQ